MKPNQDFMEGIKQEHRLLAILRFLNGSAGCASNSEVLLSYLEALKLAPTSDTLKEDLKDLKERNLCVLERVETVLCVTLTERGHDVAEGRIQVDGILRATPWCAY